MGGDVVDPLVLEGGDGFRLTGRGEAHHQAVVAAAQEGIVVDVCAQAETGALVQRDRRRRRGIDIDQARRAVAQADGEGLAVAGQRDAHDKGIEGPGLKRKVGHG